MGELLHDATLFRIRIPLVDPFRTARDTLLVKDALLVQRAHRRRHRLE